MHASMQKLRGTREREREREQKGERENERATHIGNKVVACHADFLMYDPICVCRSPLGLFWAKIQASFSDVFTTLF